MLTVRQADYIEHHVLRGTSLRKTAAILGVGQSRVHTGSHAGIAAVRADLGREPTREDLERAVAAAHAADRAYREVLHG